MKLPDAIRTAVRTQNAQMAGRCADILRAQGANYAQTLAFAQRCVPDLDADTWEGLMYEADAAE